MSMPTKDRKAAIVMPSVEARVDLQSRAPQHGARRYYSETEVSTFNPLYF